MVLLWPPHLRAHLHKQVHMHKTMYTHYIQAHIKTNQCFQASKMAQLVKALAAGPDNLSLCWKDQPNAFKGSTPLSLPQPLPQWTSFVTFFCGALS